MFDAHNNTLAATRPCRGVQTSFTIGCQFCPSLTLLSLHPMLFFLAHFDQYSLNAECQTMQECFFESTSLGTRLQDNHKLQSNYKICSRSKILRAYRRLSPPVCANWVNWPFRDQHHTATHLHLASISFLTAKYHASYSSVITFDFLRNIFYAILKT